MTLRKVDRERGFPDELDALLRWALDDRVGQVQPPAYVWERIEQGVRRRTVGWSGRTVLARLWSGIGRSVWHLVVGQPGWCRGLDALHRPMMFSVWEGIFPVSPILYLEQPVPVLW